MFSFVVGCMVRGVDCLVVGLIWRKVGLSDSRSRLKFHSSNHYYATIVDESENANPYIRIFLFCAGYSCPSSRVELIQYWAELIQHWGGEKGRDFPMRPKTDSKGNEGKYQLTNTRRA